MRGRPRRAAAACLLLAGLLAGLPAIGCRAPVPGGKGRHIVMFDGEGAPVDFTDRWGGALLSYDTWDAGQYAEHVARVVQGVRDHVGRTGSRRVLVFIHGGLNEQPETIRRAVELSDDILADDVYPIFVNWQSNLVSSWFAHLLFVRQGRDWDGWGVIVAPFYLLTDLARSLFRFPVVAGHQVAEGLGSVGMLELSDRTHARDATRELMREQAARGGAGDAANAAYAADAADAADATADAAGSGAGGEAALLRLDVPRRAQGFQGRLSGLADVGWEDSGHVLLYAVTLPVKPVSIFIVDAAGTGSWQVMRRRVELLFQRQDELEGFDSGDGGEPRVHRRREGLLLLMDELAALQDELDLRIAVVGHSMGTIVMNRLLFHSQMYGHLGHSGHDERDGGREADTDVDGVVDVVHGAHRGHAGHDGHDGHGVADAAADDPPADGPRLRLPAFEDIVYLAAACSLRDYEQSAFSYLLHDPGARVFHVVLDPDEELDEDNAFDLAPRGSLLVWVDDFLAQPSTPMDRTAGRYDNLMVALPNTPAALRRQVHVRVLPRGDALLPAKHGQFTDPAETSGSFRFWRRESWWRFWEDGVPVRATRATIDQEAFAAPGAP